MRHRVELVGSGDVFDVRAGESLLDAAMRSGVRLPHECTFGGCGTCRVRVHAGGVQYPDGELPLALSQQEADAGFALACQARACSDLTIEVARVEAPPARLCTATVRSLRQWTRDIAGLELEVDVDKLDFLPGQYMNILLDDGSRRSFSMASPACGNRVDFHVRRIPGGRFTDAHLSRLAVGDRLDVQVPLGDFRLHAEDDRPILMIATGTGVAPMRGMLETLMANDDCPPVSLYWGMRSQADLYLADEVARWREQLFEFDFVPVLSRADAGWAGARGHVQEAVARDLSDLSEHAVYLCGSPAMVAQAKARVLALGASVEHVYADSFTFHHEAVA
jgi:CDP-4-dehydro-6-deoxyglucose reductase